MLPVFREWWPKAWERQLIHPVISGPCDLHVGAAGLPVYVSDCDSTGPPSRSWSGAVSLWHCVVFQSQSRAFLPRKGKRPARVYCMRAVFTFSGSTGAA
jgi:hypothetical protein